MRRSNLRLRLRLLRPLQGARNDWLLARFRPTLICATANLPSVYGILNAMRMRFPPYFDCTFYLFHCVLGAMRPLAGNRKRAGMTNAMTTRFCVCLQACRTAIYESGCENPGSSLRRAFSMPSHWRSLSDLHHEEERAGRTTMPVAWGSIASSDDLFHNESHARRERSPPCSPLGHGTATVPYLGTIIRPVRFRGPMTTPR